MKDSKHDSSRTKPFVRSMRMRRTVAMLLCCVLAIFALAGCGKRAPQQAVAVTPEPLEENASFQPAPPPGPIHIGFLLPLGGPYGSFAQRILDGARAARAHIAGAGVPIALTVVDTSAEGWVASFEALPPDVNLVGGPLRPEILAAAMDSPASHGRAVVALMAELPQAVASGNGVARPIVEGKDAWRFFTSPEDNVRTLLAAAREVGAQNLGILYPEEPFGRRRSTLFTRMAAEQGLAVAASGYAPDNPESWALSTARMLDAGRRTGRDIDAVYIPDVWSQARSLIPNLLVQQNRRSLVLGSALWAETMDVRNRDEALLFNGSVFPGAWWSESGARPAQVLRAAVGGNAGYWEALGFDFVRLASRAGNPPRNAPPETITAALRQASAMQWAMAPMQWDAGGRASQDLYLFTPALYGPLRADLDALRRMVQGESSPAPASSPPESTE